MSHLPQTSIASQKFPQHEPNKSFFERKFGDSPKFQTLSNYISSPNLNSFVSKNQNNYQQQNSLPENSNNFYHTPIRNRQPSGQNSATHHSHSNLGAAHSFTPGSHPSQHRISNYGMSIRDRLEYASKMPTVMEKIEALNNIISNEISLKDLAANFQYLLIIIFNLEIIENSGDTINSRTSLCISSLYNKKLDNSRISNAIFEDGLAAFEFLNPNGPLFNKIYELHKKKIFVRVDEDMARLLQKFYPETLGKKFRDSNENQKKKLDMNDSYQNLHGTQDDSIHNSMYDLTPKTKSNSNLNHPMAKQNQNSNIPQFTAFELYFHAFAIYGLCLDKSYDTVIQHYADHFGGSTNGYNLGRNYINQFNNLNNNRNDRIYVVLLQGYLRLFLDLSIFFLIFYYYHARRPT